MPQPTDEIRETVRERYAATAKAALDPAAAQSEAGCCERRASCSPAEAGVFGGSLQDSDSREEAPAAVEASLGCGVPTAVADLHEGETVLDLGSGAGADVLISARRVGPAGRAIGLDMTDEMLELARANACEAGVENVEFVKGYLEEMPVASDSVDVVVSNCVINLAADKTQVISEAARVHAHASSAIIRVRKPYGEGCCQPEAMDGCCEANCEGRMLRGTRVRRSAAGSLRLRALTD